jgi:hypothetical protein
MTLKPGFRKSSITPKYTCGTTLPVFCYTASRKRANSGGPEPSTRNPAPAQSAP